MGCASLARDLLPGPRCMFVAADARLVHPQNSPAFPSCPSGTKGLPAVACACLQCHLLLLSVVVVSSEPVARVPASSWAQQPQQGKPWGVSQLSQAEMSLRVLGRRQHHSTNSKGSRCFQHLQRAFYCWGAALGLFSLFSRQFGQTCTGVPPAGV